MEITKEEHNLENLKEQFVYELVSVFEDTLNNFEDTLYNNIRFQEDLYDDFEGLGRQKEFEIAYNEDNNLNLYTTKEMVVNKFETTVERLVEDLLAESVALSG